MSYAFAEDNQDRSAFGLLLTIEEPDALIRRAVELARDTIGLVRVSIYVRDQGQHYMRGTWASDCRGDILDEHHVMYATTKIDETFVRDGESAQYSVFDDCLIVDHGLPGTAAASRAWVTSTPIRYGKAVIGLMVNDAGPSCAAFDEAKQARAAILCSLLGTALGSLAGRQELGTVTAGRLPTHRLDRLRLDRVAFLIANGRTSLADAAIAAGFETHEQFQRVSKAFRRSLRVRGP
jgi:hypothetical protein